MVKTKIIKPEPTHPIRKVCGDCYYNGFCSRSTKTCPYLQPKKEEVN